MNPDEYPLSWKPYDPEPLVGIVESARPRNEGQVAIVFDDGTTVVLRPVVARRLAERLLRLTEPTP